MKNGLALALALLFACRCLAAPAAGPRAELRCDPALVVKAIDGDKKKRVSRADSFADCKVSLAPGHHSVVVGFEWTQSEAALFEATWSSHEDSVVEFDAEEGRIYRLKGTLIPSWKVWLDDVTAEESALQDLPLAPKQKSKTRNSAFVVARLKPRNVVLVGYEGDTDGPWFRGAKRNVLYIEEDAQASTDLVIAEVDDAANYGIITAVVNGNSISLDKNRGRVCGDTRTPTFEKLTGGKVFYLGSFDFDVVPAGLEFDFTQKDIESVRQQLRATRPQLAAALEPAAFRMARVRYPCEGVKSGQMWINRNIDRAIMVTPAAAAAGSTP